MMSSVLSEAADTEPKNRALVLASHRRERQKSRFNRAKLVIRSMLVLAVEVLGGLAVLFVHLNCPAVNGLEISLSGAEESLVR